MSVALRKHQPARLRWVWPAVLACLSIFLLVANETCRQLEAVLGSWTMGAVLGLETMSRSTYVITGLGTDYVFAMDITFGCSALLVALPLFLVASLLLLTNRSRPRRVIPVMTGALVALLVLNQVRFVLMTAMARSGGAEGFGWAHTLWGSLLMIVGIIVVIAGFVVLVSRKS